MIVPLPSQVTTVLGTWVDPFLGQDLVAAKTIQEIAIHGQIIGLKLCFPYPVGTRISELKQSIVLFLSEIDKHKLNDIDFNNLIIKYETIIQKSHHREVCKIFCFCIK